MARRTEKEMGRLDFCVITGPVLAAAENPLRQISLRWLKKYAGVTVGRSNRMEGK